ncbi:class I tRNA ligase family protein, partial [bacterium]|nr:class I tRNA ligase family protein [bacterium]
RFISMNMEQIDKVIEGSEICREGSGIRLSLADRWILDRLASVCAETSSALGEYRFNDAASILYQFVWHELCDWYVELIKPVLYGEDAEAKAAAVSTLVHVFEIALSLLHPFMPFVTEELWQHLPCLRGGDSLCIRTYPTTADGLSDDKSHAEMEIVMDAITGIRSIRGELNIAPSLELKAVIQTAHGADAVLNENLLYISKLAKTSELVIGNDVSIPANAGTAVKDKMEIFVPLEGLVDVEAEIARLSKDLKKVEADIQFVEKKLANKNFVDKAPAAVLEETKTKQRDYAETALAIRENMAKLKQCSG